MVTFALRPVPGLLLSTFLLASCAQPFMRPQLSPEVRAQAREIMAHASQELCSQTYANDPLRSSALTAGGSSVAQQCQCTHDMTVKLATEQQAVRYLRATAYMTRFGQDKLPTRPFWSLEDFHALHHAAMHVCERHSHTNQ